MYTIGSTAMNCRFDMRREGLAGPTRSSSPRLRYCSNGNVGCATSTWSIMKEVARRTTGFSRGGERVKVLAGRVRRVVPRGVAAGCR